MQDVLIKQTSEGYYDLVVEDSDFSSAEGFETAIPTSFFTDARASSVQVQEASRRRGWVGNILTVDVSRQLGGMLWLLEQARITIDDLNFARAYAQASLKWMTEDSVAQQIEITVTQTDERAIKIFTNITQIDNTVLPYVTLWKNTDLSRIL